LAARKLTRPVTSSLFYEIYRRMPNDTDFTTVKGLVQGVNFANIARIEHYHTPLDTIDHADPRTLQHHGEQALAMTRALAEAGPELDAAPDRTRDAVWFDVLAFFVVSWPASWTLGIALVALALVVAQTIRLRAWKGGGVGLAASLAASFGALVASIGVGAVLKMFGALPAPWVAHPLPALLSLHIASIAAGSGAAMFVARRSTPRALWAGTWLTWAALGVLVATIAPGASFLFVIPALAAGLAARLPLGVASAVPACAAALLWMPIAIPVHDAMGFAVPALTCVTTILLVSTLPSLIAGAPRRSPAAAAALSVALAIVAVIVPPFSAEHPQRVNVVFRQDADHLTRVFIGASWAHNPWGTAPASMRRALGDPSRVRTETPTPWSAPALASEAPRIDLPSPQVDVVDGSVADGTRRVRAHLRSPRGARTLMVVLPAARRVDVTVMGQSAPPRNGAILFRGVGPEGLEVDFVADGVDAIDVTVLDSTHGVPASSDLARAVVSARPREAAETQEGDVTLTARALRL
jgi:hypothetical protein